MAKIDTIDEIKTELKATNVKEHQYTGIYEIKLNDDFTIPESAFNVKGKIMFINSPNNPNGKSFQNSTIMKLCEHFHGIVVVDEAYADFSDFTSLSLLKTIKNLIVCRTFSKTFSV